MDAMEKRILDSVAYVIKKERKRTDEVIAQALPADHKAIPRLAVATVKLAKSGIREYCNDLLHRNSKMVAVRQVDTPFYLRQLDQ